MHFTKADKLIIGALLLAALGGMGASAVLFPAQAAGKSAEVWVDGRLDRTLALRPGYRQEVRLGGAEHYNIIEVDGGRIRIRQADCPDQVCMRTGWISRPPQEIVCLPHKVVVKINSNQKEDIDVITH